MVAIRQFMSTVSDGLSVALTIAPAIGIQRMAAGRALPRRHAAAETLGSTSVDCSDKMGTLTGNERTVMGLGHVPEGGLRERGESAVRASAPAELMSAATLCNDTDVARVPAGALDRARRSDRGRARRARAQVQL